MTDKPQATAAQLAQAATIMTKARAQLVLSQPFFGVLALRLQLAAESNGSMCVDGKTLSYDPLWVTDGMTKAADEWNAAAKARNESRRVTALELVKGVVAHEVMHCAQGHHTRMGNRTPRRWNVACDAAINEILENAGFALPVDGVRMPAFAGQSAESIYAQLPEDQEGGDNDPNGQPGGCGGCGTVAKPKSDSNPGQDATPTECQAQQGDWEIATQQAAQIAKAQGQLPADLERLIKEMAKPKVDWRNVLRRFLDQAARRDYEMFPPNRRFVHEGLYLPSLRGKRMGRIAVAVDTSGSISQPILDAFAAEVSAIAQDLEPEAIEVIYCDARVQHVDVIEEYDGGITLKPHGGGGTDFRPVFEHIAKGDQEPVACVYLTDMYGSFPDVEPGYPVLWAATTDEGAPFGETVRLDLGRGA